MAGQRPAGDGNRLSQGLPSQLPAAGSGARPAAGQLPARDGDRLSEGQRPAQRPAAGSSARPSQLPAGQRGQNLTSSQKDQLRQKYQESGGLKPSQLPSRDRDQTREDWKGNREDAREDWEGNREDAREDWQNWRNDAREDWQDWYHDEYNDYWDDHWYSPWWYGYPVGAVSFSFYMDDRPPCEKTVIINQATGATTYYYCNAMWYQPAYSAGEVKYIVTAPPAGAELTALADPYKVTVGGQDYFVSNHVFYQKIVRDGQTLYVTVDAPPGARVPTIPQYAVEIEHLGQSYYRFDKIFYVRQGDFFVVVKNPGV
jgi:YHS domain-containing protein